MFLITDIFSISASNNDVLSKRILHEQHWCGVFTLLLPTQLKDIHTKRKWLNYQGSQKPLMGSLIEHYWLYQQIFSTFPPLLNSWIPKLVLKPHWITFFPGSYFENSSSKNWDNCAKSIFDKLGRILSRQ